MRRIQGVFNHRSRDTTGGTPSGDAWFRAEESSGLSDGGWPDSAEGSLIEWQPVLPASTGESGTPSIDRQASIHAAVPGMSFAGCGTPDIEPLLGFDKQAARSDASSEGGRTIDTIYDPQAEMVLELDRLYEGISQALPSGLSAAPSPLRNPLRPRIDGDRPRVAEDVYLAGLDAAAAHCRLTPVCGSRAEGDEAAESLAALSALLDAVLAHLPLRGSAKMTTTCLALAAGVSRLCRIAGDDSAAQAVGANCHAKLRAVVVDLAASMPGKERVRFLERVYKHHPERLLLATIELPMEMQVKVFDSSATLRSALGIRQGVRGRLAEKKNELLHPGLAGLAIEPSLAGQGWVYAALNSRRESVREKSLDRLEVSLNEGICSRPGTNTLLKRVASAVARPQALPEVADVREAILPVLGRTVPFVDHETDRVRALFVEQLDRLEHPVQERILASMLTLRATLPRDALGEQVWPAEPTPAWIDCLIDSMHKRLPGALNHIEDDAVAQAVVDWLCPHIVGKSTPFRKLRNIAQQLHLVATSMPDGKRRDMLLLGLLKVKHTLADDHIAHLLINSSLRLAGEAWAARMGQPGLIDEIKRQDVKLNSRLMAFGHTFDKHVQGVGNRDDREFDDLIDPSLSKRDQRKKFGEIVRKVMREPTDALIGDTKKLFFYNEDLKTMVILDPRHSQGGTAYRYEPHWFANKRGKPWPLDFYAPRTGEHPRQGKSTDPSTAAE